MYICLLGYVSNTWCKFWYSTQQYLNKQEGLLPLYLTGVECAIGHVERLRPCDRMEAKADKMPNWLSFYLPKSSN